MGGRSRAEGSSSAAAPKACAPSAAAPKASAPCRWRRRRNRSRRRTVERFGGPKAAKSPAAATARGMDAGGTACDGRGRWRGRGRDVRRRRPELGPRIHRSPRRRDDRGRQPVGRLRRRSSKRAPKWPGSAASPAKSPRSAPPGSKNGSNPARSPGSTRAASAVGRRSGAGDGVDRSAPAVGAAPPAWPADRRAATPAPARNRRSTPWSSRARGRRLGLLDRLRIDRRRGRRRVRQRHPLQVRRIVT